ncbi:MAG: hypothetical protein QXV64_01305 [Candidatus Anstonellaceae archaeon]
MAITEERIIVYFPYVGENPRKIGASNPISRWPSGIYPAKIQNKSFSHKITAFLKFTILVEDKMTKENRKIEIQKI